MDSGKWIRELREERFVKSSDIERISRSIADIKGNADFYVSPSTLADIETGSVPSIQVSPGEPLLVLRNYLKRVRQIPGPGEAGLPRMESAQMLEAGFRFQLN